MKRALLISTLFGLVVAGVMVLPAYGQNIIPGVNITVGQTNTRESVSATLQILILLTVLTLAPAILMMTTSFVRLIIILGFIRQALGTQHSPPNQVLIGLALFGIERGGRELAPEAAVAPFVVLGWIVLTGGLHLDGVADSADGLFGGRERGRRRPTMPHGPPGAEPR